jgi:hypothetical protein
VQVRLIFSRDWELAQQIAQQLSNFEDNDWDDELERQRRAQIEAYVPN